MSKTWIKTIGFANGVFMKILTMGLVFLTSASTLAGECRVLPIAKRFMFKAEDYTQPIIHTDSIEECVRAAKSHLGKSIDTLPSRDDHGITEHDVNRVDYQMNIEGVVINGSIIRVNH